MADYAAFIWPAFLLTGLGLGWMVADSLWRERRWRREVERLRSGS